MSDDPNELSWLKGHSGNESGDSRSRHSSPNRARNNAATDPPPEDAPSWLHEENDDGKSTTSSVASYDKDLKKRKPLAMSAQHIRDLLHQDEDNDEECCFCLYSDPVLLSFQCFHFIAGATGIGAMVANAYTITRPDMSLREIIVRSYTVLFCVLIAIVEIDWRYFVGKVKFMDLWIFRGLFYAFVGLLTVGASDISSATSSDALHDILGIMLVAIGLIYIVMGTFCMKTMKLGRIMRYMQLKMAREGGSSSYNDAPTGINTSDDGGMASASRV